MVLEWGQAKIEANALRDEILAWRRAGWTVGKIYTALFEAGRITMSRRSFFINVTRIESQAASDLVPPKVTAPAVASNLPATKKEPSSTPKKPDPNDHLPRMEHRSAPDIDALFNGTATVEPLGGKAGEE